MNIYIYIIIIILKFIHKSLYNSWIIGGGGGTAASLRI